MRRHAALLFVLTAHAFVIGMALLFHLHLRVSVAQAFSDFGTPVPALTAVAISEGFLPAAVGGSLLLSAAGWIVPMKRSRRAALLGAGLCVSSFALIFAILAAYFPMFKPG